MKRADNIGTSSFAVELASSVRLALNVQAKFVLITDNTTPSQLRQRAALPGTDYLHEMPINIARQIKKINKKKSHYFTELAHNA